MGTTATDIDPRLQRLAQQQPVFLALGSGGGPAGEPDDLQVQPVDQLVPQREQRLDAAQADVGADIDMGADGGAPVGQVDERERRARPTISGTVRSW